jgi:hypothetical protein
MPAPDNPHDDRFAPRTRDAVSDEPDVLLDVPALNVEEIDLEVEDLTARVSLRAEVLDLLKLHVGADVELGRVALKIKGVEAQAMLKVRLDNVAAIIDRVLTAIENTPELLEPITRGLGAGVEQIGKGAGEGVGELGRGAGAGVGEIGRGAGEAVQDVGAGAGKATEHVGRGAGEAVEDVGAGAGKTVEDVGETAHHLAGQAGSQASGAAERIPHQRDESDEGDEPPRSRGDETVRRRLRGRYDARRGRGRR